MQSFRAAIIQFFEIWRGTSSLFSLSRLNIARIQPGHVYSSIFSFADITSMLILSI